MNNNITPNQETVENQTRAEQALLGALMLTKELQEAYQVAASVLTPQDFLSEEGSEIFRAMGEAVKGADSISLIELERLSGVNKHSLVTCISQAGWVSKLDAGVRIVKRNSLLRQISKVAQKIKQVADENEAEQAAIKLKDLRSKLEALEHDPIGNHLKDMEQMATDWMSQKAESLSGGLDFGWSDFDDQDLVMKPGHLIILGARPKQGKSTVAVQVAMHTAKAKNVVFFSLEMSGVEITDKLLAYAGDIPPSVVQNWGQDKYSAAMTKYTEPLSKAINELKSLKLRIFDEVVTIWRLEAILRKFKEENPIDMVVVDQLSFVQTDNKFDRQGKNVEYDFIVANLKRIAKELKVPIMLLVQLNRDLEKREKKIPQLSDLKDSGRIEEAADLIILLRKDETKNIGTFHITNRHGAGCIVELAWDDRLAKYGPLQFSK